MADWHSKKLKDVIAAIKNEEFVLPVIQRRLEWDEDKMELLFNSLLKGYSFGAIIGLEEQKDSKPLFAFRKFILEFSKTDIVSSSKSEDISALSRTQFFVIDGQQRLQSFYIGLCGSYNKKLLYFDLYGDWENDEYGFKFAAPGKQKIIPTEKNFWYPVKTLFEELSKANDADSVADKINDMQGVPDDKRKSVERNIRKFYGSVFNKESVGISQVTLNKNKNENENRQRMVELFQRLNREATRLNPLDFIASRLKGFDYKMEDFLDTVVEEGKDMGFGQDEIVKLLMTLRDTPLNSITDLDATTSVEWADFALNNAEKIKSTLKILREFLKETNDYKGFNSKAGKKYSPIPLYVLAYHIFYAEHPQENFADMKRWLRLSMLNGIFRRGCGWVPSERGMIELHNVLKNFRGQHFPTEELFDMCQSPKAKLHSFHTKISADNLDEFIASKSYLFYLVYDGEPLNGEEDHIQARDLLLKDVGKGNMTMEMIDSIANCELLSRTENRTKGAKKLKEWIKRQPDKQAYLKLHLIPEDENLWRPTNFKQFLKARAQLIADKINDSMR